MRPPPADRGPRLPVDPVAPPESYDILRARLRAPTVVYVLYGLAAAVVGIATAQRRAGALACLIAGAAAWTLVEYVIHRWIQHRPRMPAWYLRYDNHPAHHTVPDAPENVAFSIAESLPILLPIWVAAFFAGPLADATSAGFTLAYIAYEWIHFASHSDRLRAERPWLARFSGNHLRHHWQRGNAYFGFVTTFWDRVLGTYPPPRETPPTPTEERPAGDAGGA